MVVANCEVAIMVVALDYSADAEEEAYADITYRSHSPAA